MLKRLDFQYTQPSRPWQAATRPAVTLPES